MANKEGQKTYRLRLYKVGTQFVRVRDTLEAPYENQPGHELPNGTYLTGTHHRALSVAQASMKMYYGSHSIDEKNVVDWNLKNSQGVQPSGLNISQMKPATVPKHIVNEE